MEMPTITCELPDPKEEDYFVLLNSTQCATKTRANDDSPFSYCNITHNFQYLAYQVNLLNNKNRNLGITNIIRS